MLDAVPATGDERKGAREETVRTARRREPARGRRGKGTDGAGRSPVVALFRHGTQGAIAGGRPRRQGFGEMVPADLRGNPETDRGVSLAGGYGRAATIFARVAGTLWFGQSWWCPRQSARHKLQLLRYAWTLKQSHPSTNTTFQSAIYWEVPLGNTICEGGVGKSTSVPFCPRNTGRTEMPPASFS